MNPRVAPVNTRVVARVFTGASGPDGRDACGGEPSKRKETLMRTDIEPREDPAGRITWAVLVIAELLCTGALVYWVVI